MIALKMNALAERAKHAQITSHFRQQISAGTIKPGDRLPTYKTLADEFDVSVATVRRAMTELRHDGLLTGTTAEGTIVAEPGTVSLDWDSIKTITLAMHDEIEAEFSPDIVLTMSGPGGFAALLSMSYSARLVPVVASVTFPVRAKPVRSEVLYRKAAKSSTWKVLETGKWHVYLPKVLEKLPPDSRVLIFDDRMLSGTTQRLAKDHLEQIDLEVRTAALVVSTDNVMNVDFFGTIIDDGFAMPWGTKRGRT